MAASDYVKAMPDSIDRWMPRRITSLGTDGFGRSEGRAALRDFFEVDAKSIVLATLVDLARDGAHRGVGGAEGHRRPRHQPRQAESGHQLRTQRRPDAHRRGSRLSDFTVPELGENVAGGDVAKVLVKVGDTVRLEQPVIELETDKATIEVPSTVAGVVTDVRVKKGDKVKVGAVIFTVCDDGAAATARRGCAGRARPPNRAGRSRARQAEPARPNRPCRCQPSRARGRPDPKAAGCRRGRRPEPRRHRSRRARPAHARQRALAPASPGVRRLAREIGVDINTVIGTGPGGRISQEDVKEHARRILSSVGLVGARPR